MPGRGLKLAAGHKTLDDAITFKLKNPRKGTETTNKQWLISKKNEPFKLKNPRKGTET